MRSLLKKSRFLTGLVKACRALPQDWRVWRWMRVQPRQIAAYLAAQPVRKLHLGCGHCVLDGWLNADIAPAHPGVVYLDATAPFPIDDATFDYIYSEHVIQHFPFRSALVMLRECHRILKPGGVLRLSTPNLLRLVSLVTERDGAAQREYTRIASEKYISENTAHLPAFVVNNFFWDFTHQFVHDPQSLRHALARAGFTTITAVEIGASADAALAGLENHGRIVGDTINTFETMIFEARK
jgi:predicted SAM-dependent methyltransferase